MGGVATDPVAAFTLGLLLVGAFQVGLFYVQLRLIRETLGPAKEAAEAAKESANALVAAESARVLIFPVGHNYWQVAGKFAAMYPNSPEMGAFSENVKVWYSFKNYGKTPGILKHASVRLEHSKNPPESVTTSGFMPLVDLPVERVIDAGKALDRRPCDLAATLTMEDAIGIAAGDTSIWLIGYVAYDDVFERECTQDFLYKLLPAGGGFVRYYDKSTYRQA